MLSPESLYWIGWLFANVKLTKKSDGRWTASLYINNIEAPDGSHPYKDQFSQFLCFMGMENHITENGASLVIRSTRLATLLISEAHIDPEKPLEAPENMRCENTFWAGFLDQNSIVGRTKRYWYLDVQGSLPLLSQLVEVHTSLGTPAHLVSAIMSGKQTSEVSFRNEAAAGLLTWIDDARIAGLRNPLFLQHVRDVNPITVS